MHLERERDRAKAPKAYTGGSWWGSDLLAEAEGEAFDAIVGDEARGGYSDPKLNCGSDRIRFIQEDVPDKSERNYTV